MKIQTVGVVGCGLMGAGIAEVCARSGYSVVATEINSQLLNKGLASINTSLTKAVERGRMKEEEKTATLGRLRGTLDMADFRSCDLVIEAILEDMAKKKELFAQLGKICPKTAILATNTSCLSVTEMAIASGRPDRVVGLHFFNPATVMKLVEIVKTIAISQETLDQAKAFSESLGKKVIFAPDVPGFVVNRLLLPYVLDAMRLLEASTATAEDIDQGMMLGCNYPMGPLALADLIGLDVITLVTSAMYDEFKEPRFAPPPSLRRLIAAGRLGRKTGQGFYKYS